jgi:hypothetical protein
LSTFDKTGSFVAGAIAFSPLQALQNASTPKLPDTAAIPGAGKSRGAQLLWSREFLYRHPAICQNGQRPN